MMDKMPSKRRLNDDPVVPQPALVPARSVLTGSMVRWSRLTQPATRLRWLRTRR
jgi:hypothetical protein